MSSVPSAGGFDRLLVGLRRVERGTVALSRAGAELSGWLYLFIALFITSDILTRRYLGFSTKATDELGNYVLATGAAWSMAYALQMKDHVRMEVVLVKLPRVVQGYLNILSLLLTASVLAILVYRMWSVVLESVRFGSRSFTLFRTPLAWPQGVWAVGFTLFLVLTVVLLIESVVLMARGRVRDLAETLGPRSIDASTATAETLHGP
jgi:TRAP-type mannitol/chloroaromatic compound transport system permease small subunit